MRSFFGEELEWRRSWCRFRRSKGGARKRDDRFGKVEVDLGEEEVVLEKYSWI